MFFHMKVLFQLIFVCMFVLPSAVLSDEKGLTVKGVRYFSYAAFTRIVFEIEAAAPYVLTKTADGHGILLAAHEGAFLFKSQLPSISDGVVSGIEAKEDAGRNFLVIRLNAAAGDVKDFVLRGPDRIVVDVSKGAQGSPAPPTDKPIVIVLDAGHGGKDTGIVTSQGQEKSITLELAQAIKKYLQKERRLKVILTREKDQALTLDERAAISNAAEAMVFVSLHAAPGASERVYIQDPDEDLGTQAQYVVNKDFLSFEAGNDQQEKLWERQQAAHAKESGALGRNLARQIGKKDNAEPQQAPISGLKAIDAAAVMIEIGMEQDRIKTAEVIAKGIEQHVRENR